MEKIKKNIVPITLGILLILTVVASALYYNNQKNRDFKEPTETNTEAQSEYDKQKEQLTTVDKDDANNAKNIVTVYLLHASYCPHCKKAHTWLQDLVNDYDYLSVKAYEISDDDSKDNRKLYQAVGKYFNDDVRYIPYIIVGDIYHDTGFGTSKQELIKLAIEKSHTSTKYHDVVSEVIATNKDLDLNEEAIERAE